MWKVKLLSISSNPTAYDSFDGGVQVEVRFSNADKAVSFDKLYVIPIERFSSLSEIKEFFQNELIKLNNWEKSIAVFQNLINKEF